MKKRFLAEMVGTFGVCFLSIALSASGKFPGGDHSLSAGAWASGLAVIAMIYSFGHLSGAHFNPAVTLGFAVAGRFPWNRVAFYSLAQVIGAILAMSLSVLIFGSAVSGAHLPATNLTIVQTLVTEATLSFLLMCIIMAAATDTRFPPGLGGLAIGLGVVSLIYVGGPVTGASMNPARSLAPALVSGGAALSHWWLYLVGPCIGTSLAARFYETIRGDSSTGRSNPRE